MYTIPIFFFYVLCTVLYRIKFKILFISRWSSPTGELLSQESKDGVRVEGGVLNISRVLKEFAGTYKVSVNNSEGVANTSFKLDILYSPRLVIFFYINIQ